jgi:hypothetical protein
MNPLKFSAVHHSWYARNRRVIEKRMYVFASLGYICGRYNSSQPLLKEGYAQQWRVTPNGLSSLVEIENTERGIRQQSSSVSVQMKDHALAFATVFAFDVWSFKGVR